MKTRIARSARSFTKDESGAALVEFAIVAIILLILIFGILDFGRMMYLENSLTNAAREGGRYAAVLGPTPEGFVDAIKDTVVAHMPTLGSDTLKTSEVTVAFNYAGGAGSALQSTTVTIHYPFNPWTPVWSLLASDSVRTLKASAQFRCESCGG